MISPFPLSELERRTSGQRFGKDVLVERISIDSRDASGALFVAIKGERLDGHDYIDDAVNAGCSAVVLEHSEEKLAVGLKVKDSVAALGHAGAINREAFNGSVVALTGSAGKTTTKNMLASVLARRAPVTATKANHNNEIGVPLTLLDISSNAQFAVIEMGARHLGDIRYLGQFVQPDIAVVLNAGSAHLGEFGSYENIVKAKGELYGCLRAGGTAVMNLDDIATEQWVAEASHRTMFSFSVNDKDADLSARNIDCLAEGSRFDICYRGEKQAVFVPLPGRHNVSNALAASAVAILSGMSLEEIADGLALAEPTSGRMKKLRLETGSMLFDDSYNANPVSMKAALDVLALQAGTRIAVLGEMAELGDKAKAMHLDVAEHAKTLGIDELYCVGSFAQEMALIFGEGAMSYDSKEALAASLKHSLNGVETVLVKGSRSAGMEDVVTFLSGGLH